MSAVLNFLKFHNPNLGELLFAGVLAEVINFMKAEPRARYKVMIGSDSNGNGVLDVVSVVAVHRVGNGGRYFWCRSEKAGIHTLRQKIYAEVQASLDLAVQFLPAFRTALKAIPIEKPSGHTTGRPGVYPGEMPFDFEIHVDVGRVGETRDLVQEITGMVRGYGYEVLVKPESAAATTVADRHVR